MSPPPIGENSAAAVIARKLKALGVSTLKPSPLVPGVPPIADTLPGYEVVGFTAVLAPPGTPPAVIERLNAELERRIAERTRDLSDAMSDLEGFAYTVAHDLRAPLRALSGFCGILIEDHGSALDAEPQRAAVGHAPRRA